ncbi:MAG: methyltransferase domain-containing protein [Alphaproteobacteria bacterium]|nr:methyltransferase domain-containing protein [Alphaproteobacteria bacterium]
MTETEFTTADWRATLAGQERAWWKDAAYAVLRPVLSANARRRLSPGFLAEIRPDAVFFTRGTPLAWRRRWGAARVTLGDATVLVQGTGTGWDAASWAAMRPRRLIATDLFAFDGSWEEIARHCRDAYGVTVEFRAAPLEDHGFLADGSVDLCASDAVLEHCTDLAAVLAESRRVLRPGGTLYATYGPIWFAPGGDHFSGRDGLASAYNHVALAADAYRRCFEAARKPVENFQSGGRYVELGLFSKLTTREYLAAYAAAGLARDRLILEISPDALAFRRRWPDRFRAILDRNAPRCTADDLLVKANFVRLIRP